MCLPIPVRRGPERAGRADETGRADPRHSARWPRGPVTPGYFLIGLSSLESDMQRNVQLLKERAWFDIPIIYNNNRRAILAMEKGTPGEQAFSQAFAAWKQ